MRRYIQLRQSFATRRFDSQAWAIELPISGLDVVALMCETTLLLYGRSEQLSLLFDRGKKLMVSVGGDESTVNGSDDNPLSIRLNRNDAEYVLCFLLTWYRDGVAEANHIDIELTGSQSAGKDCMLVIEAEKSQPPLPGDEAERILRGMQ